MVSSVRYIYITATNDNFSLYFSADGFYPLLHLVTHSFDLVRDRFDLVRDSFDLVRDSFYSLLS
jgi:hypothetical protein